MLRHCIFVKFAGNVPFDQRALYLEAFTKSAKDLAGVRDIYVSENLSNEIGMDKGFSDGLVADLDDIDARNRLVNDPPYTKAMEGLLGVADGGFKGIMIFDMRAPG